MEPEVRFCTTSDGVRIAYATMGKGPPLVDVSNWISRFKYMAHDPRLADIYRQVASNRQLVLYDRRGTGMSDPDVTDFSRGVLVKDLEAVIDHLKLRRVVLHAWDTGAPVALEYAFRHPERVSHLILIGTFARGRDLGTPDVREGLIHLIRGGWKIGSETIALLIMPGADPETARRYFTALRESCSAEAAAAQEEAVFAEDVTELLPQVKTPTLVLHSRGDRAIPFKLGRELASLMPNARLVALDYDVHMDLARDPAPILQAIDDFLAPRKRGARVSPKRLAAPSGFRTILFTDIEGSTAMTQRLGDAKAREVLREHERITRECLRAHGGSEVKTMGDGFMASFGSATKALECAIAIQRAFEERNASKSVRPELVEGHDAPLRVRIGLNAGEPIAEDDPDGRGDLFGTAVIRAARIAALAQGGEILVANVVRELAEGKGFLFGDRGDVALRGFDDPVRLFEVRWREEA